MNIKSNNIKLIGRSHLLLLKMTSSHDGSDEEPEQVHPNKQSKWWWFTIQCDTNEEALEWLPPPKPLVVYCCWRAHAAPTTGKPHVHVLVHYRSGVRYSTMANKGYHNMRFLQTDNYKSQCRRYCVDDLHKDGTPKNPIGPFLEQGEWDVKQGTRSDLVRAKHTILSKRRWEQVLNDEDITEQVAKYGKWGLYMHFT